MTNTTDNGDGSLMIRRPIEGQVVSLVGLATIVLRRARFIITCGLVGALIGGALGLKKGATYTAFSTFMPQSQAQDLGQLAGMAAQFGLRVPTGSSSGESLDFYAQLVRTRQMLSQLATAKYEITDKGRKRHGTLLDLYEIEGKTPDDQLLKAVKRLEKDISVGTNLDANLVHVNVRAPWKELSVALSRGLLDRVSEFNLSLRQSKAKAERVFAEERLKDAQNELARIEAQMKGFIESNRKYSNSPQLTFEAGSLQRQIDMRQQVVASLSTAYEQARISEVRNTPVVTVVDPPEGSARRKGNIALAVILGLITGALVGLLLVILREGSAYHRAAYPQEHEQLVQARRSAFGSLLPGRSRALPNRD